MQLCEIPVSLYMQTPQNNLSVQLKDTIDPEYYADLKNYLDTNPDYRKSRIEWRKTRPDIKTLFHVKDEFFRYYRETDLEVFHRDVQNFLNNNTGISSQTAAERLCDKWNGYGKTYGVEFVRRAIERCQNET